ncbi:MAG: T9SS type A sorting domain-containing protein [Bacteroidota bacterium]
MTAVHIGECGDFIIHTTLDPSCDSTVINETRCVEAYIFPDTLCFPTPGWDGSSIEVNSSCLGDSIHFYIQNVGTAPMSEALNYIVIEDNIMCDQGDFMLAPQAIKELIFEANGSTMRLEADQANDHPGFSMPSTTVEACDPDGDGLFSMGFFNQWPMDDADPFRSIECLTIVGAFDPNDKRATPLGIGPNLFIEPNTDLEYHIRFQNIGNDTAFNVIVLDTLSPFLDLTSIQLGASSFPYDFAVLPERILQFTFNQINLLPEEVDEIASQGFVKFRISQVPNNPIGTFISNEASIFFDRNAPIITNFTFHQVGIPEFISSNSDLEVPMPISVFPNPFQEQTQLVIHDPTFLQEQALFTLYNAQGQIVRQSEITEQVHTIHRSLLPSGIYFYTISHQEQTATGKLVIQ